MAQKTRGRNAAIKRVTYPSVGIVFTFDSNAVFAFSYLDQTGLSTISTLGIMHEIATEMQPVDIPPLQMGISPYWVDIPTSTGMNGMHAKLRSGGTYTKSRQRPRGHALFCLTSPWALFQVSELLGQLVGNRHLRPGLEAFRLTGVVFQRIHQAVLGDERFCVAPA